ncbi:hypothetical protein AXF42_Ash018945 [Apostasia shenzhenica]|uniref:DUF7733 domain-containing protein n=1 Tax=Apostasia shenzhenica TaxID=1088818 RepID=A0A2I0B4L8_9ASPA|nr:hypothetical protein AXF42_Ash018945 [Apostasia shenzhenica]
MRMSSRVSNFLLFRLWFSMLSFCFISTRGDESTGIVVVVRRSFRAYMLLGATMGIFLQLAYVLVGFTRGDNHAVWSATPHLFLLSCQILTGDFIAGHSLFSLPVRAMVPLFSTFLLLLQVLMHINGRFGDAMDRLNSIPALHQRLSVRNRRRVPVGTTFRSKPLPALIWAFMRRWRRALLSVRNRRRVSPRALKLGRVSLFAGLQR